MRENNPAHDYTRDQPTWTMIPLSAYSREREAVKNSTNACERVCVWVCEDVGVCVCVQA